MNAEYLSEEEQYKETLNQEEISKIKDLRLKEIRNRYFYKKLELLKNGKYLSDTQLMKSMNFLEKSEQAELEEYKLNMKNQ